MNRLRTLILAIIFLSVALAGSSAKAQSGKSADNAALRYWAAFAQVQDSSITEEQAKEAHAILEGTAPYADLKYKDLVEKNRPALETMARGTTLPYCDWGMEMQMGPDAPVDYARKAAQLGRLNIFYAFHLLIQKDKDGAVRTLQAGLRFSHDVANGGTLFATVVAQSLIVAHLKAASGFLQTAGLTAAQKAALQKSIDQLGPDGLDWSSAMKREMEILPVHDAQTIAARDKIEAGYVRLFSNPGTLADLQQMISNAPKALAEMIPGPKRVLEAQQELTDRLQKTGAAIQ